LPVVTDALAAGGTVGGRYELEALIGKGGFAEVWRARHVALNSRVAIKFLLGTSAQSESMRRRFTTEAQITAQLKSQNAVQVFDFGFTDGDRPFLVMELLEGETLGRRLERVGRLDVYETARILGQSSRALHRAHQLGIVHRDFKPENVVIAFDDEGRDSAKVLDFGIAKLVGDLDLASATDDEAGANGPSSARFTKAGAVLGTPRRSTCAQTCGPSASSRTSA
jgi:serine/threonine-protein kinase